MANAFDNIAVLLREMVSPAVLKLRTMMDPPEWNLMSSFDPETQGGKREYSGTEYPTGYDVRYKIEVQKAGRVAGGRLGGNTLVMAGHEAHLAVGSANDSLSLDPRHTPRRSHIEISMPLYRMRGSLVVEEEEMRSQLITDPVEDITANLVEDAVMRVRRMLVNQFVGNGVGWLAQVDASGGLNITETAPGTSGVAVPLKFGTYQRFMVGDRILFAADPGGGATWTRKTGTLPNSGVCVVVDLDEDNRQLRVNSLPGEGTIAVADSDYIIPLEHYDFLAATHAAAQVMPPGLESFILSSGVFPGTLNARYPTGLNVTDHQVLKGWREGSPTSTGSSLVEPRMENLTILLDRIIDTGKEPPVAWLAERSIWTLLSILEREDNMVVNVPMGQVYNAGAGVAGPVLGHMEHRFQKFNSTSLRPNTIFGMNPRFWKLFIPLGDRTLRWRYGNGVLSGYPSIFGPTYDGFRLADMAHAPFDVFAAFGLIDPKTQMLKFGVKSQRDTVS